MGRRLNSCLLGIAVIFLLVTFHSLFNILFVESSQRLKHSGALRSKKFSDYIGVNGEAAIFPLKCDTCALIGTSGHLRKSTSGRDIDKSYSCIFRLGFSPTRGYEDQVGSRTTARIVDSFRFYPFLKKPLKLVTGPFPSDFWFLFDRAAGDISRFHGPLLKDLLQKHDSKFLWFSRAVERSVLNSLDSKRLKNGMNRISSLLFATRVIEDAGCESLTVYGVPDAQICKRNLNISIPSLYWDENSFHLCDYGVDASVKSTNSKASVSIVPSIAERRLLPKWLEQHFYASDFKFPSWENWTSP
ncbi:alpha-N-acetylgalactosaminide alpha-2,6-sialyltransferase 5-like [Argiope bruennichi]|uniref:alpha-N-acetylgalactosaminide alpha-2,6-sialyltransferase 5-like n=1 Tax=Argiope bruennichi TaxID=94029 RepID=UPI002493E172|nr:alpha-N-acetylgalactosaminide alpha-2,6-sialyltransferase 5-like [Argiope bruennichi]